MLGFWQFFVFVCVQWLIGCPGHLPALWKDQSPCWLEQSKQASVPQAGGQYEKGKQWVFCWARRQAEGGEGLACKSPLGTLYQVAKLPSVQQGLNNSAATRGPMNVSITMNPPLLLIALYDWFMLYVAAHYHGHSPVEVVRESKATGSLHPLARSSF